ncbi:exodeoxyribonuclease III [Sinimarinibacterium sp. NLF-5-8]|uniref:exodeoxyribonuclease III n=1 Tax=Sinimarinibacterium sp. NLF-5-8 TaxID=2698684 RepID=UPI00137BC254|nr:exodeoxyribonuclease III [Sinimarinibacterium sp. NLF-5-8]QHS10690.1 exodeoxyribonuclease III [Sinimarinibacterium sp. NLF-5-8]
MRIVSFNANGIRSAARKGFFEWLDTAQVDVLCVQETKAQITDVQGDPQFFPKGWQVQFRDAVKKGYSGVAIYARAQPDAVLTELGAPEFDDEGRYLEYRFGNLSVVSLYLPSGSSGEARQASKDRFLAFFLPLLRQWKASGREYVICGDWNIAHRNIDLKNWRGNLKNSGFLPHERAWLDTLFDEVGFVDGFRARHPEAEGDGYTWWSNRGQAYANNVGWRIDYQITTPAMAAAITEARVYKDQKFSDHAPLILDYAR